jgi:RsiW-degrading membrane proteinase PrsW (M82 family)
VTANATALSVRAATLAPKENQFDFVLVGGVVILIAAVVGAFYYLRKRKSQGVAVLQPPSQPQQNQENPY